MLKKVLERPPFPEIHTARYLGAVDDLCGEGRWHATTGVGHWPILLPGFANPPWRAPEDGWHVDIKLDQPRIESAELGLLNIEPSPTSSRAAGVQQYVLDLIPTLPVFSLKPRD